MIITGELGEVPAGRNNEHRGVPLLEHPGVAAMFGDFEEEITDLAFFSAIYYLPFMLKAKFAEM